MELCLLVQVKVEPEGDGIACAMCVRRQTHSCLSSLHVGLRLIEVERKHLCDRPESLPL